MIEIKAAGNAARDAELRFTNSGKAVLSTDIFVTNRRKKNDQWEDDGAPVVIRISVWGPLAELLAEKNAVRKGARITFSGKLVREVFDRKDGTKGESLKVPFVDAIGIEPPRENTQNPWPQQQYPQNIEPPF